VRRADRSPLKFNAKLSRPFSIVPIRLSAPYYDPAEYTLLKAPTFRDTLYIIAIIIKGKTRSLYLKALDKLI
jgi:hypothetical protein